MGRRGRIGHFWPLPSWPALVPAWSPIDFPGAPAYLTGTNAYWDQNVVVFDWVFRSRETGRITIGQTPNVMLSVFVLATVVRWIVRPSGTAATVIGGVATGALVLWALDELVRGVNPWRRALGAGVLTWQVVRLFTR